MNGPTHHISESLMLSYVAGALGYPHAVVVACHLALCAQCRALRDNHAAIGGALLRDAQAVAISPALRARVMDALEDAPAAAPPKARGDYPAPLTPLIGAEGPKWRWLGPSARQSILWRGVEGSLRLLRIEPNKATPDHGHNGLELTLVLQGGFTDEHGAYERGDLEIADGPEPHRPTAMADAPCVCLAATDAPLRFNGLGPRIFQSFFRI